MIGPLFLLAFFVAVDKACEARKKEEALKRQRSRMSPPVADRPAIRPETREERLQGLRNELGDAMHGMAEFVKDGKPVPQVLNDRAELLRRQINVLDADKN